MPASTAPLESRLGFWLRYVSNHASARFAEPPAQAVAADFSHEGIVAAIRGAQAGTVQ